MNEPKLILKRIGLKNPTEVHYGSKILVTNELDIQTLCNLWKWYFNLPPFGKIELYAYKEDFYGMQQRIFAGVESVAELFFKNGFILKKLDESQPQIYNEADWCIVRQSELNRLKEQK